MEASLRGPIELTKCRKRYIAWRDNLPMCLQKIWRSHSCMPAHLLIGHRLRLLNYNNEEYEKYLQSVQVYGSYWKVMVSDTVQKPVKDIRMDKVEDLILGEDDVMRGAIVWVQVQLLKGNLYRHWIWQHSTCWKSMYQSVQNKLQVRSHGESGWVIVAMYRNYWHSLLSYNYRQRIIYLSTTANEHAR